VNPTDFFPYVLYPYFLIIGSSILVASAWLLSRYHKQIQRNQELIRLNEDLGYDLPDFLRQCWPLLSESGFAGISWKLNWFGTTLSDQHGKLEGNIIERKLEVQEISLYVNLYQAKKGWEAHHFNNALADSFFLLVRMNLWIKLGTVQGAFEQTAKMTVFLQHDVKNMVQLMSLTVDQLEKAAPGQELNLIGSLKMALPAVRDRAQHMLDALINNPGSVNNIEADYSQQLEQVLRQTADIYELPVNIKGEARVNIDPDRLQSIVDNLLGNYSHQARKNIRRNTDIRIELENRDNSVVVSMQDVNGDPCLWPERLFEPFWSEHGSGRGIGLYQAKQQASAVGGDLSVNAKPDRPLQFRLSLPSQG
jgi:hypothetical protein